MAFHLNEVHELISICTSIKSDITQGKVPHGQNYIGIVDHVKKNLRPVSFSKPIYRARGILNLKRFLVALLPEKKADYTKKYYRIEDIMANAEKEMKDGQAG